MYRSLIATALASAALATHITPPLFHRDTDELTCADVGEADCGDYCIPLTYTCCPDQSGGCPATEVCWLGSNGEYGCCPIGETCDGPGGVATLPGGTITSTQAGTGFGTSFAISTPTATFTPDTTSDEGTATWTTAVTTPTETESETFVATESDTSTTTESDTFVATESTPQVTHHTTSTSETLPTLTSNAFATATPSSTSVVIAGAAENIQSCLVLPVLMALAAGAVMI
jgi:hypothetical protein